VCGGGNRQIFGDTAEAELRDGYSAVSLHELGEAEMARLGVAVDLTKPVLPIRCVHMFVYI
jgi:hypothetical protein